MQVSEKNGGFTVVHEDCRYVVEHSTTFGWCVFTGANLDLVGRGYPDGETACNAVPEIARKLAEARS